MIRMSILVLRFPLAALLILSAALISFPQDKRNDRPQGPGATPPRREDNKKPPDPTRYSYEFTKAEFVIRHILIEHDALGLGKITFERRGQRTPNPQPLASSHLPPP